MRLLLILLLTVGCSASFKKRVLQCPKMTIRNNSNLPWTKYDAKIMIRDINTCAMRYPKSPCPSEFIKRGYRDVLSRKGESKYYFNCAYKK